MPGSLRRSGAFFAPFSLAALQLAPFAIRAAELRAPLNSTSQMIHSIRLFYDDDSSTPVRDPTRNWVLYHCTCRYYTQSVGAPTGTSTLCCEQEVDLLGQLSQQAARLEEHHVCIILGTLVHHVFVSVLVIVKVSNDVKRQEKYHSVFTILCSVFCVLYYYFQSTIKICSNLHACTQGRQTDPCWITKVQHSRIPSTPHSVLSAFTTHTGAKKAGH